MDLLERIKQYFHQAPIDQGPLELRYFKRPKQMLELRVYNKRTGEEYLDRRRMFYTFRKES